MGNEEALALEQALSLFQSSHNDTENMVIAVDAEVCNCEVNRQIKRSTMQGMGHRNNSTPAAAAATAQRQQNVSTER